MRKKTPTPQEEMIDLRRRIENLEMKLSLIREPLLIDALAYELLGLKARMNFLFAEARNSTANR